MEKQYIKKCRCCDSDLPLQPIFSLNNMPKSAQNFPAKEDLKDEIGITLELYQCLNCGTMQLAGEPVPYYRDVIRAVGVSPSMKSFRLRQFRSFIKRHSLIGKKILEIGCGTGDYLSIMEKSGALAYGVENNSDSVKTALTTGHKVFQGFMEDESSRIAEISFDAFYCLNFLEHIPNPRIFLHAISANLKSDGKGLIEVPNSDMVLSENLYSELIQDHLLYFTKKTFIRLLESNGFEVLSCRSIFDNYILSAEIQKRRLKDITGFTNNRQILNAAVNSFFEKMIDNDIKIAIWGAGHQALANISLLNMNKYAICVLDSAEFKQNKYTPASHLPILSPEVLNKKIIGAVLIIAGGYSQEIKEIIYKNYPWVICAVMTSKGVERDYNREDEIIMSRSKK